MHWYTSKACDRVLGGLLTKPKRLVPLNTAFLGTRLFADVVKDAGSESTAGVGTPETGVPVRACCGSRVPQTRQPTNTEMYLSQF